MRLTQALASASFLVLAACAGTPSAQTIQPPAQTVQSEAPATGSTVRASRTQWAQANSDIPADPAIRFGTLSNGMRYAIMHNATPPGQASLRLRVDAGSLMEADDQRGLAHFMEHMAFNGTTNVPEGELLPILERLGLAFGPDTNAFTSFDQTVYQLDLPQTDTETVSTALMIMRDMVGGATLAADAIDRERGIVLSEERTRASPGLRLAQANFDFLMRGQRARQRFPIGDTDVLSNAPRDRFTAFYDAYYRPERTTLVAVGDFDVEAMEARIQGQFSDWSNAHPNGAEPDLGAVAPRTPEAFIFSEAGAPLMIELAWVAPPELTPDTIENRRRELIRSLGFAVLNRRLQSLGRQDNPAFVSASASRSTLFDSQDQVSLTASYRPGEWQRALAMLDQERRRILEHGITVEELTREITEYRTSYESYVAGASTRTTPALADGIASSVNDQEVYSSPQTGLDRFNAAVDGLTPDRVMAELRSGMAGDGPLVFVSSPTAIEEGTDAVMAALAASQGVAVEAAAQTEGHSWPYTGFGPSAPVVEQSQIEDIGVTSLRFANGVRLIIKPTDFRDDEVLVAVNLDGGRLTLSNDRVLPVWGASSALIEGGLGQISREDMEAVLASNVVSTQFGLSDDDWTLGGSTRPQDLTVQLQALAAYVSDPAFRPQAFERVRTAYQAALPQVRSTPSGAFGLEASELMHGGDQRWAVPSLDEVGAANIGDLEGIIRPVLDRAPIEIVVVGDVEVDTVIQAVAATFGGLPQRAAPAVANTAVRFPAGEPPVALTHAGRADQALGFMAWSTTDATSDVYRSRVLNVLAAVLRLRLVEELREGQAVTYSPSAGSSPSWDIPGYGYLSAAIEAPPERLDGFFSDVEMIAAQLRDTPVTADELERARRPIVESIQRGRAGNEYWLGNLSGIQTEPTRLSAIRSLVTDFERVSPEDLQAAAREYLTPQRVWRIRVVPEATE
ncbi:M16 family metallopeptidase [Brevundimonas aveniformis]|uniref:M16 family metallopeptidase n=1 Tax=Brevundimonas aveniformis TaxID=370977 RepID=UPI002490247B|nr:M16 family metallopeptidase [Brevundimonas aveniformis]